MDFLMVREGYVNLFWKIGWVWILILGFIGKKECYLLNYILDVFVSILIFFGVLLILEYDFV